MTTRTLLPVVLVLFTLPGCPRPPQVEVQPAVACPACPDRGPAASQPARAASQPARLGFLTKRKLSTRNAPFASLDKLLDKLKLHHADVRRFRAALAPYLGSRIRWRLRSFGDEVSLYGYNTPDGFLPTPGGPVQKGRIRLMSTSPGLNANISTADRAGHPVVSCLASFPHRGVDLFLRSDRKRARTPKEGETTIEALLWGVTSHGNSRVLWLDNCAVVTPGP